MNAVLSVFIRLFFACAFARAQETPAPPATQEAPAVAAQEAPAASAAAPAVAAAIAALPRGPRRFLLEPEPAAGVVRKMGDRVQAWRYAVLERGPAVRVSDITDPKSPVFTEVPFEYRPGGFYPADEPQDFRVAGRRYTLWADVSGRLHVAPRRGLVAGEPVHEQENVAALADVFQAWIDDVTRRSRELNTTGVPGVDGRRLRVYFELLKDGALRISLMRADIFKNGTERFQEKPLDVAMVKARPGRVTQSRLMFSGRETYRFLYDAAGREVTAEEVR